MILNSSVITRLIPLARLLKEASYKKTFPPVVGVLPESILFFGKTRGTLRELHAYRLQPEFDKEMACAVGAGASLKAHTQFGCLTAKLDAYRLPDYTGFVIFAITRNPYGFLPITDKGPRIAMRPRSFSAETARN